MGDVRRAGSVEEHLVALVGVVRALHEGKFGTLSDIV